MADAIMDMAARGAVLRNVTMREYLEIQAVNSSLLGALVERCPQAAWHESWLNLNRVIEIANEDMDIGTIGHSIVLEGSRECIAVIDPKDHPAKTTGAIPEGWTNASIRAARDAARAAGKVPVLAPRMRELDACVSSVERFIDKLERTEPAIWSAFRGAGDSELTVTWDDELGVPCKMRPDRINAERDVVVDVKFTSTSAEPNAWGRSHLPRMGYHRSAAFYRRGAKRVWGTEPAYVFLVVETAAPYLCSLVGVDPAGLALGAEQVEFALRTWKRCVRDNDFPGYPPRVAYAEIPPYAQLQWEEAQSSRDVAFDQAKHGAAVDAFYGGRS